MHQQAMVWRWTRRVLMVTATVGAASTFNICSLPEIRHWEQHAPRVYADEAVAGSSKNLVPLNRNFVADAARRASPAVVHVRSVYDRFVAVASSGSGFIIDKSGIVVTNSHVIDGASKIVVCLQDGRELDTRVLGASREADIALLQIESEIPNEEFATIELGNSDVLQTGEFVVAVGSPLHLRNTVTFGIVSSECRSSFEFFSHAAATSYIQTDAPINQGNSGGPLLNLDGQVIGINSMKASMSDGIGFAIPITPAKLIIDQILLTGSYTPPFIGLRLLTLTKSIMQMEKQIDPDFPVTDSGILVVEVMVNSPAESAGMQAGDVIISCNERPAKDVAVVIRETQAGKPFTLNVLRGERSLQCTIAPISRPEPPKPKRRWRW